MADPVPGCSHLPRLLMGLHLPHLRLPFPVSPCCPLVRAVACCFGFVTVNEPLKIGPPDLTVPLKLIVCRVRSISAARTSSFGRVVRYSAAITLFGNPSSAYLATASSFWEQRISPTGGFSFSWTQCSRA